MVAAVGYTAEHRYYWLHSVCLNSAVKPAIKQSIAVPLLVMVVDLGPTTAAAIGCFRFTEL